MKKNTSFFIAIRYLWGRAHEGVRYLRGAAAGIAVSLIPIMVTLIVADGMIRGIIDRYLELGTGHIQITDNSQNNEDEIKKLLIENVYEIKGIWFEKKGMGIIAGLNGKTGVTVRAIESSFWDDLKSASLLKIIDGVNKPLLNSDIILGETLADNIGVQVGDDIRLMTIRSRESGVAPGINKFTVKGIISCGYNELDALLCITNWEGGKRIFSSDQIPTNYLVKIDDPYKNTEKIEIEILEALGSGYKIETWKEMLQSQYTSYETTRQLLLFIMALVVVVAAVNVSSATSMLVLERQRDIAVLKVSGASVKGITAVFIWGSFLTGLTGSIIGISIGLLLGYNINIIIRSLENVLSAISGFFNGTEVKILDPGFYLETIPIVIDWNAVLVIALFAILCSVAASWIPARKAGKLKPMELLRKT